MSTDSSWDCSVLLDEVAGDLGELLDLRGREDQLVRRPLRAVALRPGGRRAVGTTEQVADDGDRLGAAGQHLADADPQVVVLTQAEQRVLGPVVLDRHAGVLPGGAEEDGIRLVARSERLGRQAVAFGAERRSADRPWTAELDGADRRQPLEQRDGTFDHFGPDAVAG